MENFCLRRYNLIRTGGSFRQWVEDFLSGSIGTENLTGLLRERFMADGFEESLVREELDKLAIRVRHERGMPQSSSGIRNKEVSGGSPVPLPQSVTKPCTAPLTEGTYTGCRPSVSRSPAHRPHTGSCGHCRRTRP